MRFGESDENLNAGATSMCDCFKRSSGCKAYVKRLAGSGAWGTLDGRAQVITSLL